MLIDANIYIGLSVVRKSEWLKSTKQLPTNTNGHGEKGILIHCWWDES